MGTCTVTSRVGALPSDPLREPGMGMGRMDGMDGMGERGPAHEDWVLFKDRSVGSLSPSEPAGDILRGRGQPVGNVSQSETSASRKRQPVGNVIQEPLDRQSAG